MTAVNQGDTVKVHFTGRLLDGTIFDSTEGRDPLTFKIGDGRVIAGFEKAVLGMSAGESKTETIQPQDGYGDHQSELLLRVDRCSIPDDAQIEVGQILQMGNDQGATMNVLVTQISDDVVILDANHPLAGMTLEFTIELVEIVGS
jgi:FKBP-type peptidyl-prolyl cis-trans isomerase 2